MRHTADMLRAIQAVVVVVALASVGSLVSSCVTMSPLPAASTLSDDGVHTRLTTGMQKRERVEAIVKAALPGPAGAVVSATVDVAAEAPRRLSVSVRSFFEMPTQVLVANDDVVTLYDASSGSPRFSRGPASDKSLQRVLGVPLAPDDVVALILGRAPLQARDGWAAPTVKVLGVDQAAGTYTAKITRAGRGVIEWTARYSDDALVSLKAFAGDGRALVVGDCSDFVDVGGVVFAKRVKLRLVPEREGGAFEEAREVVLTVQEATFNGPPLPPEAFTLEPPPGTAIDAL